MWTSSEGISHDSWELEFTSAKTGRPERREWLIPTAGEEVSHGSLHSYQQKQSELREAWVMSTGSEDIFHENLDLHPPARFGTARVLNWGPTVVCDSRPSVSIEHSLIEISSPRLTGNRCCRRKSGIRVDLAFPPLSASSAMTNYLA